MAGVADRDAWLTAMLRPAGPARRAGGEPAVRGADTELTRELDREAVPVVTLGADVLPRQARSAPLPAA